jgi:adenine-specific DNA-methyltransferase
MEKLNLHSPDFTQANIEKMAELFPNCITETRAADGTLKKAIDFDLLKQELSTSIVEGPQERYQLNWPGKREALLTANAPIAKTLRPCREESVDFDSTQNLYIEGDNLDALKLLQETYLGKVKMIYIDPPYNTGNDFIYEDDFAENTEAYFERSNQKDEVGNRLVANNESNGRFHSDWLSMMYSRLKLARNLLRDDGVIFISIDDNEQANLKRLCDEVFGEDNFVAQIEWQKRYTRSNNTDGFTSVLEHILCYGKSFFKPYLLDRTEEANNRYSNPDNDPRGPWKAMPFSSQATPAQRPNLCYEIVNPNTQEVLIPKRKAWRSSKDVYEKYVSEKLVWWGNDGTAGSPSIKKFLAEARDGMTPINFWAHEFAGNTDVANREIKGLFVDNVFDTPKPTLLIKRMLTLSTSGLNDSEIILDFFSGSSTTADAIMQINAEDGGKRKFIMVQLPEVCDSRSEACKAGYSTIAEIGKERIRRAGKKIKTENPNTDQLDIGFRVLKVDSSNMKDVYYTPDKLMQGDLEQFTDNIRDDSTPEDLLFQVLLDWGVDLTLPITQEIIAGFTVLFVDDNALAACFDADINEAFVKELAARHPMRVVFRDAGFASDSVKINIEQIFKLISPATEIKTL